VHPLSLVICWAGGGGGRVGEGGCILFAGMCGCVSGSYHGVLSGTDTKELLRLIQGYKIPNYATPDSFTQRDAAGQIHVTEAVS
jgi:hypothetical protein